MRFTNPYQTTPTQNLISMLTGGGRGGGGGIPWQTGGGRQQMPVNTPGWFRPSGGRGMYGPTSNPGGGGGGGGGYGGGGGGIPWQTGGGRQQMPIGRPNLPPELMQPGIANRPTPQDERRMMMLSGLMGRQPLVGGGMQAPMVRGAPGLPSNLQDLLMPNMG